MSKKRVNKTKEEIVKDMENNGLMSFKNDLKELEERHGYRLEPVMYYSKMGAFPQIEVVKIKEELKEEEVV